MNQDIQQLLKEMTAYARSVRVPNHTPLADAFPQILAYIRQLEKEHREMQEAAEELIEVARLRGDNVLPHPADSTKQWTARMQEAWNHFEKVLSTLSPQ